MGEPIKIMDNGNMVKLHGLTPYMVDYPTQILPDKGDIPVCVTGLRKVKLYEELLIGNNPTPTKHPRIMTASVSLPHDVLMTLLDRLLQACETFNLPMIITILQLPLEYAPPSAKMPDLIWCADQETKGRQNLTVENGVRADMGLKKRLNSFASV